MQVTIQKENIVLQYSAGQMQIAEREKVQIKQHSQQYLLKAPVQ